MNSDSLVSDFTQFVHLLEETHPDPYTGFGGRYFFHNEVRKVKKQLGISHTAKEFVEICSAFLSHIPDQHTYLNIPGTNENVRTGRLNIEFRVMPEGLYIKSIDKKYGEMLGGQVKSVNKIPIAALIEKINRISASENKYGSYLNLSNILTRGNLVRLFPNIEENLEVGLLTPQGEEVSVVFPVIYTNDKVEKVSVPNTLVIEEDDNLSFGFANKNKDIMYWRVMSIMAQENYEYLHDNGMPGLEQQLKFYYDVFLKKQMPEDIKEAIKGVPSFLDTFTIMLEQMKVNKTKNLIIDLRGNTGGYTPITLASLYMLFGDEYLNTPMDVHFSRRVSELWLKKMNMTLDELNKSRGTQYALGDFTFSTSAGETDIATRRKDFIDNAMCSASIKEQMKKQNGQPLYRPEYIYVLTNVGTFSAAFHYTFYLWKMGAKIAGVPCRQAPNTFMEGTWFELPYTGAQCSISNSIQIFLPSDDERANVFYPDIMPKVNDYIRYGFDLNVEVLHLLDYIKNQRSPN